MEYLISYDLGTGGLKSGLYTVDGTPVGFEFHPYQTFFPAADWHEQRPLDWWQAMCVSTRRLINASGIDPAFIRGVAASGHSLVCAPIDADGNLLLEQVPIWSDRRAQSQAKDFFSKVDYHEWYLTTGNGDPPEIYSVFKLMWLKQIQPDLFSQVSAVPGSKDYLNFKLTGNIATDYSYASGSGVFDLHNWQYRSDWIEMSELPASLFLPPVESFAKVGEVTSAAAEECGLLPGTPVFCGGVDNACMALGTTGLGNGRIYTSLGSSAWIAVSSEQPVLDTDRLPFIFAHVEKGFYTSGTSIFAAGNCFRWVRDILCDSDHASGYAHLAEIAASSPPGANGLLFNPALSGGSSQEPGLDLLGGFFGLTLAHTRADLLRAVLEGVALSLRCYCLSVLEKYSAVEQPMILCGGGARSDLWMQIFADVYDRPVARIQVDQEAASLGAAAIAARGAGLWADYSPLDSIFKIEHLFTPNPDNRLIYQKVARRFTRWVDALAAIHAGMKEENEIR
jgi:xylulokinase